MRISLLLKRERFEQIFCSTVEEFTADKTGHAHRVRWHGRISALQWLFGMRTSSRERMWVCNAYINAIFRLGCAETSMQPLVREFSRSPSVWRRPIQRAYVAAASWRWTAPLLAHAFVSIDPGADLSFDWVFVGGNNKIRILDGPNRVAYAILKTGAPRAILQREIDCRARAGRAGIRVPLIVSQGRTWLSEEFVVGTPVNRLESKAKAEQLIHDMSRAVAAYSLETAREESLSEYVGKLSRQVDHAMSNVSHEVRCQVSRAVRLLHDDVQSSALQTLTTAIAHGDFQPANILFDDDRSWLIDWEFSERRQLGYDGMVWSVGVRMPNGLRERLLRFAKHGIGLKDVGRFWKCQNWSNHQQRVIVIRLLLLEEINLQAKQLDRPGLHPEATRPVEAYAQLAVDLCGHNALRFSQ